MIFSTAQVKETMIDVANDIATGDGEFTVSIKLITADDEVELTWQTTNENDVVEEFVVMIEIGDLISFTSADMFNYIYSCFTNVYDGWVK